MTHARIILFALPAISQSARLSLCVRLLTSALKMSCECFFSRPEVVECR